MSVRDFIEDNPWVKHLILMIAASLGILILIFLGIKIYARQGKEYSLPEYVGTNFDEVSMDNVLSLNFVVIDSIYNPNERGGIIISQEPVPGTMVKKGRKVYLTITSFNPEDAVMPDLVGGPTLKVAISTLERVGLKVGKLKFIYDDIDYNTISAQYYNGRPIAPGNKIPGGSAIDLTVTMNADHSTTVVPKIIGMSPEKARKELNSAALNVGREHFENAKDRRSAVVSRWEPSYTGVVRYPYGTAVDIWYVSKDEVDVNQLIKDFKVDSSQIYQANDELNDLSSDYISF